MPAQITSARMVRILLLINIPCLIPAPALATGTLRIIAEDYTQWTYPFSISRDSRIAVPWQISDLNQYGFFVSGTNSGIYDSGLASYLRAAPNSISKWGVATITSLGGFPPSDLYAAPLGQPLQLIQSAQGYAYLGDLRSNDSGRLAFSAHTSFNSSEAMILRWDPGQDAQQLPSNGASAFHSLDVDGSGRIFMLSHYTNPERNRMMVFSDSTGWQDLTSGFNAVSCGCASNMVRVNPSGQFTFPGTYDSGTKQAVYLGTGSSFVRLFDRPFDGPNHPIDVQISLSDRGDVLGVIGTDSPLESLRRLLLYTHDGKTIDLETLLPPGKSAGPFKRAVMNYDGDVLVQVTDIASNTLEYYRYGDSGLSLLLDGQSPRSPQRTYLWQ